MMVGVCFASRLICRVRCLHRTAHSNKFRKTKNGGKDPTPQVKPALISAPRSDIKNKR